MDTMTDIVSGRINNLIMAWNNAVKIYDGVNTRRSITRVENKKYTKLITSYSGQDGTKSVYCFIDKNTGDIFKPASWNSPMKGVRGTVMADDFGMSICLPYGIKYLKGQNIPWD